MNRFLTIIGLMLLAVMAIPAGATTYTVNSSQSTATIQGVINGTVSGADTVVFSGPGTYNITAGLTLKCGVTYTGPVVTPGINGLVTPTAILAASTRGTYNIFNLFSVNSTWVNPCTQPTVIEYLNFANTGALYVRTSVTNLTFQYNTLSNIPCCGGGPAGTGIYIDGSQSTSNTAQQLTSSAISWNLIGDAASCLTPQSAFADVSSPDGNGNAGQCNGITFNTSMNGVTVHDNNFFHVSEGAHILCPSPPGNNANGQQQYCEPVDNGVITDNFDFQFNDFSQNHRINYEEQPQTTSGVIWKNNSIHDMLMPTAFSFGLSFACCGSGGTSPFLTVSDNVLALNVPGIGRFGYGIEAWGRTASYNNNYVGITGASSIGIAWAMLGGQINNNTVCGSGFAAAGYVASEGESFATGPTSPPSGNTTSASCTAYPSVAPSISPAPGTHTFPLTVTFTDPGYATGPVPQGNTGIWYTTDGSNPVPGAGTAKYTSTGGTISLTSAGTVRAVGMWGAQNQPTSYPSGYGFTPSAVVSASYTSSGPSPTLSGVTVSCASGSLIVGASLQCTATCSYSPGSITDNCTNADQFGTDAGFSSSNSTVLTVTGAGVVTGAGAGAATVSATAGSFTSPTPASVTVTAPTPTLIAPGVFISCGGVNTLTVGQTLQCTANCTYTGNITTNCTTTDTYGTLATPWVSSIPADMTVTSGGLVTAVAVGAPIITVSVPGFTRQYNFTVNPAPPTATLTGVIVTGASNTVTAGQTLVLTAQCQYSDLTTTNCTTTDSHGTLATSWASSATGVATVGSTTGIVTGVTAGVSNITVSAGSFTSPATGFPVTVTAIPSTSVCGNNQVTVGLPAASMQTFPNYFNSVYCVTGTTGSGYTAATGAIFLPSGTGQQLGALWDLVVIPATSGTAQAATAICKGTYTVTSTTGPGAFVPVTLGQISSPGTACHLAPSTAYWIGTITNTSPGPVPEGFWSCGSTTTGVCTGSLPSSGNGTYPYRFVSNVYGSYTNMTTTLGAATAFQPSSYVTLTTPAPSLVGGFLNTSPTNNVNTLSVGQTLQFIAYCVYSDSTTNQCFPQADQYNNTVISWSSSNMAVMTVGATGSNNPGLATGISGGPANVIPVLTGNVRANVWGVQVQTFLGHPVPGSARQLRR